ncbi:MAG: MBL fold metallo-hydrolase [Clostridiales bacterium]|nr:MBL fold metallo-hydrolase [Clostridiales bacterium]
MKVVSLASGSKGNSYLIITDKTKILIDEGLSEKELIAKLSLLQINIDDIDAIFITHEHDDHIKGLATLLKKYSPKVYIHNDSVEAANKKLKNNLRNEIVFYSNDIITFNDICVENFTQSHDSKHCCGFSISDKDAKVSISTDLGTVNRDILNHLYNSNIVYLEANHDEHLLLDNPNYPAFLKQRILSNNGHLSNKTSSEIIKNLSMNNVRQIILSHLSEENNSPSLAYNYIKDKLKENNILEGKDIFIDVARQDKIGTLFNITKK